MPSSVGMWLFYGSEMMMMMMMIISRR